MNLRIYFLASSYLLLCYFTSIEALIGDNVRAAEENEFPFIVAIAKDYQENNLSLSYFCAGTLISRKDVLTSAHCLSAERLGGIQILVGSSYLDSCTRYYPLWWITFDQWAQRNNHEILNAINDIAIAHLIFSVPDEIVPANIWISLLESSFGMETKIAGWGLLQNNSVPNALQVGTTKILSKSECESITTSLSGRNIYADNTNLCTISNPYVLLRPGDSGGPLFHDNVIIGINFGTFPFSAEELHPNQVNIHVFITYYFCFLSNLVIL